MDSSTPFYKQLTTRFFIIFGFFVCTLTLALALLHYRDQQVIRLVAQQLPTIEKSYQLQSQHSDTNELLSSIIHDEYSQRLLENHQLYLKLLGELKRLSGKQTRFFEQIIRTESAEQENIRRLTSNHQRNMLLRQNSIIQLQLVLDELNSELIDKEAQQAKLFQQITQDKVTDKVTASRAKAHANLTQVVNLLRQTSLAVKNIEVLFSRINLQYSLDEFNFFSEELSLSLSLWQPQFEQLADSSELATPLLSVLFKLEKLLFSEQNAMAKWRSHLRLSQAYFLRLKEQQSQLQIQRSQLKIPVNNAQLIPNFISELSNNKVIISTDHLRITILVFFVLLVTVLWWLLSQLKSRIRRQNLASVDAVEQVLSGQNIEEIAFSSAEEKQLVTLVSNVAQPKHSESDYQLLANHLQHLQTTIFGQIQLAYYAFVNDINSKEFHSRSINSLGNELAQKLIFSSKAKVVNKSWPDAFSFSALKTIIHTARKAEQANSVEQCDVSTRINTLISITIFKKNNLWQGTVAINEKQAELAEDIEELNQQLSSQQSKYQQLFANNAEKLSNMLIRTMLQSQSVSIGSGVTSLQVYRQLTRILNWSRQLQINTELQRNENIKTFVDVNTRSELFAISQNVMGEASQQRNKMQLALDSQLLSRAKINVHLFHCTLVGLSRLCLLEQFNSTLLMQAEVVDKNSGQQTIRFTLNLLSNKPKTELPELITALIGFDGEKNVEQKVKYLHSLLTATYCENILATSTELGFKVSIDMPLAYTENITSTENSLQKIDLKETEFIVVGEQTSFLNGFEKTLKSAHGKVELIEQTEHLIKHLNVKHLTKVANKQQLSAVIITSQVFKNDGHLITQHLQTLPNPISPKLVVLQSPFANTLHSEGFFENTESPCETHTFVEYLANFIHSDRINNLLIPAEVFSQYRFCSTQVEVLLAVESPEKYQNLSRLLSWLGLQVYTVCQAETMQKYWQSGRYLVLLTEFQVSPFIEMKVGKNVSRGVFSLGDKPLKEATEKEQSYAQSWHQDCVKNQLDIQRLVKLFAPWLKEKQLVLSVEKKVKPPIIKHTDESLHKRTPLNTKTIREDKALNVDELLANQDIEIHQAFDLNLYALHQGSPELAVFMLDDYMAEIEEAIAALPIAIKEKSFQQALGYVDEIDKLSTILAAQELNHCTKALTAALNKKALPEVNAKLKLLTQQYQMLTEFVQTI